MFKIKALFAGQQTANIRHRLCTPGHCQVEVVYFEIDEVFESCVLQLQWLRGFAGPAKWPLLGQPDNAVRV
jgi:hypothetical protein